jgi:leucyl aminopeptidase
MATLTGAQLISTGKKHASIVSNCPALEAAAWAAGRAR